MIDAQCIEVRNTPKIKCKDGNRFAVIVIDEGVESRKIKVDGCAVTDGVRADFVIESGSSAIVIELKGKNVEHGAEQVFETSRLWKNVEQRCARIAGLIVARQFPRASATMQRRQDAYAKAFKGPLHVVTHNPELRFDHVLSFKGPLRA